MTLPNLPNNLHSGGDNHEADFAGCTVEQLIGRMRSGDREAAAVFITRYGSRVRRRVRGKLGPSMRRIFDSEEILSTVGRRLDLYVRSGKLQAAGESQLWSLIFKMADCAVLQKRQVFDRLQRVESGDSEFAHDFLRRLEQADREQQDGADKAIEAAFRILPNEVDRRILSLWLSGELLETISDHLGITAPAARKRWQVIKEKLRAHLGAGETC